MKRFFTNPFLYMGIILAFWAGFYIYQYTVVKPRNKKVYTIYEKISDKQDTIFSNLDYMSGVLAVSGATLDTNKFTVIEMVKVGEVIDSLYYKKKAENTRLGVEIEVLSKGLED